MEDGRVEFLAHSICSFCQGRDERDIYSQANGSKDVNRFLEDTGCVISII